MTKKITALFIALVMALSVCVAMSVSASAKTDSFIFDETIDGALTESELDERNAQSEMMEREYGYTVMVVITEDTNDLSAEAYGNVMFSSSTDSKNGIVLVHYIDVELAIHYEGKAEGLFDEETEEAILSEYGYADTYVGGIEAFQMAVEEVIEGNKIAYEEYTYDNENGSPDAGNTIGADSDSSADNSENKRDVPLVLDLASLLSDKEEEELNKKLENFSKEYEMDLAILTVTEFDGKNLEAFAKEAYKENDYGYGKNKDGALFVRYINEETGDKEVAIYAHGKAEDIFTEEYIEKTFDAMQDDIKAGKYASAFNTYIDMAKEGTEHKINPIMLVVFVLAGMLIGLLVITIIISKNKSVIKKQTASLYTRPGSMMVTGRSDVFVRSHTTKREKADKDDNESSGSRDM